MEPQDDVIAAMPSVGVARPILSWASFCGSGVVRGAVQGAVRTDIRARPALRNERFAAGAACLVIRAVKDS